MWNGCRTRSEIIKRCIPDLQNFNFCRVFIVSIKPQRGIVSCRFVNELFKIAEISMGGEEILLRGEFRFRGMIEVSLSEDINDMFQKFSTIMINLIEKFDK